LAASQRLSCTPVRCGLLEGLLAKNPADRLTGEQARVALLDLEIQQELRPGQAIEVEEGGVNA
jgi:hypothetical protein